MSLNKKQLIARVAEDQGLTIAKSTTFVDSLLEEITAELRSGGSVDLHGFGKIEATRREARAGRNPSTGEAMTIAAKNSAKFKPAKALVDKLNA
jgi:DNA-binding protein HU-beta